MSPDKDAPGKWEGDSKFIVFLQYLLPTSFTLAMIGIVVWILSLIRLSTKLQDVPSASVGISIVAIPVFLILLGVFWYVFLGIMLNQEDPGVKPDFVEHNGGEEEPEN